MSQIASSGVHNVPATAPAAERRPSRARSLAMWLGHAVPNIVVFSTLGLTLWWGHHSGWKLPSLHQQAAVESSDWCSEHLVPESACVECNGDLLPKPEPKGFCKEHGVAECVICNPELAQSKGPPVLPKYDTVAAIALVKRAENNSRSTLHERRVQFASTEAAEKAGLEIDIVGEKPMTEAVIANGEVSFNPTSVAHLSTKAAGTVVAVFKQIGDAVHAGDVLAIVDAATVGEAKSELLESIVQLQLRRAHYERLKNVSSAVAGRSVLEAESEVKQAEIAVISARQALVNLGFEVPGDVSVKDAKQFAEELHFVGIPTDLRATLPATTVSNNLIAIRAPLAGVLLESQAVSGEVVESTDKLFTVADSSRLWLNLSIRQEDAPYVKLGQRVEFSTDDGAQTATGDIAWISPRIDEKSRTLQARVELSGDRTPLRDMTFGTARIVLRHEENAIVVPREAVQVTPEAHFVFVRDRRYFEPGGYKVFHVRQVRVGARSDTHIELLAGALPGEVVATEGSSVLLAQLLRGNLGAGCGCHEE